MAHALVNSVKSGPHPCNSIPKTCELLSGVPTRDKKTSIKELPWTLKDLIWNVIKM